MISRGKLTDIVNMIEYPILKSFSHLAIDTLYISNFSKETAGDNSIISKSFSESEQHGAYRGPVRKFNFGYTVFKNGAVRVYFKINDEVEIKKELNLGNIQSFILELASKIDNYFKRYDDLISQFEQKIKQGPGEDKLYTKTERAKGYLRASRLTEIYDIGIELHNYGYGFVFCYYPEGHSDRYPDFDEDENMFILDGNDIYGAESVQFKERFKSNGTFESNISCVGKIMKANPTYFVKIN